MKEEIKKTVTKSMRNIGPIHEITYYNDGSWKLEPTDLSVTEIKKILSPDWFEIERKPDVKKGTITWTFFKPEI